jgi:hypothetical protein
MSDWISRRALHSLLYLHSRGLHSWGLRPLYCAPIMQWRKWTKRVQWRGLHFRTDKILSVRSADPLIVHNFEAESLALFQAGHFCAFDGTYVDQHINATVVGFDETIALRDIEPSYGSSGHSASSHQMRLHHRRSRRANIDLGQRPRSRTSTLRHGQTTHDRKMSSRRVGGRLTGSAMSRGRALHGGEALYRDMRAGARRDFTCLESRRAPGKMGSRLGRTVVVLGEFAFARRARTARWRCSHEVAIFSWPDFLVRSADAPIVRAKRWKLD